MIELNIISVGTGRALEIGRQGDADMVLVHSRELEEEFVREGYGERRVTIMYNEFVVVGPSDDPARAGGGNVTLALERIMLAGEEGRALFVSRGDNSGTHVKELEVWGRLGVEPARRSWYIEAATGMGGALRIAYEKRAYLLMDIGTWISLSSGDQLGVIAEGDPLMINPYSAILVSREKHPDVNREAALRFIGFLTSDDGQRFIQGFLVNGQTPFRPIFGRTESIGLPSEDAAALFWEGV